MIYYSGFIKKAILLTNRYSIDHEDFEMYGHQKTELGVVVPRGWHVMTVRNDLDGYVVSFLN